MNRQAAFRDALMIFLFAAAVRLWLIHVYPAIFGGDTVLRMANRDRIQLAYQLPLLQTAIFGVSRFFDGPAAIRCMMAVIGGIASVGCYRLATDLTPRHAALLTGLLFASNPFLIELSIVPYQEVMMIGALLFAIHFFFLERWIAAGIALGLACLTRYEAWAACPVLAAVYLWKDGITLVNIAKAFMYFAAVPVAWIVYHAGISAPGTFVIEWPRSPFRLMRWIYLGWITVKNSPLPVLILAGAGIFQLWKTGAHRERRIRVIGAYLLLVVFAILFSAHGEAPDPERFVTAREASIWIAAVLLVSAIALRDGRPLWRALAIVAVPLGVIQAHYAVGRDTSTPQIRASFELARYLDASLARNEEAVVLTKPVPLELVRQYLDKVAQRSGEVGLRQAGRVLRDTETTPPDYQRTLVHSELGKNRIVSLAGNVGAESSSIRTPRCAALAAVWSDFSASNSVEAAFHLSLASGTARVHQIRFDPVLVTVYRLNTAPECR
jgi:hypothetical protein